MLSKILNEFSSVIPDAIEDFYHSRRGLAIRPLAPGDTGALLRT